MSQWHKRATENSMVVGGLLIGEMKYLIFAFPRPSNKAKRGVESRHSTRNISRIRWKMGWSILTYSLCLACWEQNIA